MIGRDELDRAVRDGLLTPDQADALWARATRAAPPAPPPPLPLAARLLAALAVAAAPLATHLVLRGLGRAGPAPAPPETVAAFVAHPAFPPLVAAALAAGIGLRAVGAPFLSGALAAVAWAAAMLGAPVALGPAPAWTQRALLSALVGAVLLAAGAALDGRTRRDHAAWLYLAGLLALCGGLATVHAGSPVSYALAVALQAGLVAAGLLLGRRVFAAFGGIGLAGLLGELAEESLAEPALPVAYAAIGLALLAGAASYDRLAPVLDRRLLARLPATVRRLLPPRRSA